MAWLVLCIEVSRQFCLPIAVGEAAQRARCGRTAASECIAVQRVVAFLRFIGLCTQRRCVTSRRKSSTSLSQRRYILRCRFILSSLI